MYVNNTEYEILTPSGWKDFKGITTIDNKKTYKISLENGCCVEATADHCFFIKNKKIKVKELKVNDKIDTTDGSSTIISIDPLKETTVYDIIKVTDDNHQFIVNNCFITKNCDELAFIQPNIAEEWWSSISPTLTTGGKVMITSTPNSDEDTFATLWKESQHIFDEHGNEHPEKLGSNGFFGFQAFWWEHPDRDEAWKQAEIGKIGIEKFGREFECKFYVFDETLINSMKLEKMSGVKPLYEKNNVRWYKKPTPGNIYLLGLDPSMGTGGDNAAIEVYELPSFTQVAEWQHNFTSVQKQVLLVKDILQEIVNETGEPNNLFWSTENNTVGEAALIVINDIGEDNFPGMLLSETPKKGYIKKFRRGFNTTFANKLSACSRLKYLIEEDKMIIHSKPLISELKGYIANKSSFKAKSGMSDDLVAATLLIVRMCTILAEWDHRVYDTLSIMNFEEDWIAPMPFMMTYFS